MFNPQEVNRRVDAYRGNPQGLMQKYAVSQELIDLLALQQINKEKQDAARQMQLQMAQQQGQAPEDVATALKTETLNMTRQDMANRLAPVAQMQQQQQTQGAQAMQGIAANAAPNMSPQALASGGIVGYQVGGIAETDTEVEDARRPERKPNESFQEYRSRLFAWELETNKARDAAEREKRESARETERQQRLAARGGEPIIPPSPFFDRAPLARPFNPATDKPETNINMPEERASATGDGQLKWGAKPSWLSQTLYDGQKAVLQAEYDKAVAKGDTVAIETLRREAAQLGGTQSGKTAPPMTPVPPETSRMANVAPGAREAARTTAVAQTPAAQEGLGALGALYEQRVMEGMQAQPDFSQLAAYRQTVTDPTKAIADQRMAAMQRRSEEAGRFRDQQLAAMQDNTPRWLQYLQQASAAVAPGKSGLGALGAGAVSLRKIEQERAMKAAEVAERYAALVNKYEDAGFGVEESKILAEKDVLGERSKAEQAAATRRKEAATEAGQTLRTRESAAATLKAAEARGSAAAEGKDSRKLYDLAVDNAQKRVEMLLKTPSGIIMTPAQLENVRRKYLAEEMANLGLQVPSGAAGAAPGTSGENTASNDPLGIR